MEEEQALRFLKSKGYTCMGTPPSSHVGVSARKMKLPYSSSGVTAEAIMADPAHQAEVQQKLIDAGVFKKGGKKRSCKKRSCNKRSCKKRSYKKRSYKKRS
jgi:hypothetical protein